MDYLIGYSEEILIKARQLVIQNQLPEFLFQKYPALHTIKTDKALYAFVIELKNCYIRHSPSPSKVMFDTDIRSIKRALGTHTTVSRVQGGRLKTKNEIRIASLFKHVPLEFLKMITVHELAHLKEKEHNKAFYKLCINMEPDYHQIEFDLRLYLTHVDMFGELDWSSRLSETKAAQA